MEAINLCLGEKDLQCSLLRNHLKNGEMPANLGEAVRLIQYPACRLIVDRILPTVFSGVSVEIGDTLMELREQDAIREVVGSAQLRAGTAISYSTFVTAAPRGYFSSYTNLLKRIRTHAGVKTVVWLEDQIALARHDWSMARLNEATETTRRWFELDDPDSDVLLSSSVLGQGVPLTFIDEVISRFSWVEFLELLPFHHRDMSQIRVFDISHAAWHLYCFYSLPGLHLVGINSKRSHVLSRKLCGKSHGLVLVPITT